MVRAEYQFSLLKMLQLSMVCGHTAVQQHLPIITIKTIHGTRGLS